MFKTSHLSVQSLIFSHFAHSVQKILIECQFYLKTTRRFGNSLVMKLGKIGIAKNFSVWKGQSERKLKFGTPK
jgi:hypothetical protein